MQEALRVSEDEGIVFIDEIDKIAAREGGSGAGVSREGVQRDLLPLVEGTTVATKYGPVKTDHILFITSGAFHVSKPSDLLPELQGRLPIRVELSALTREDFRRILTETEASLIKQYIALMETEEVKLEFSDDAIDALADIAVDLNATVENIGARRLQTVMEKVLDEISFTAPDKAGATFIIDAAYVKEKIGGLAKTPIFRASFFKTAHDVTGKPRASARFCRPCKTPRLASGFSIFPASFGLVNYIEACFRAMTSRSNRSIAGFCLGAIPNAKPLRTFAGIALAFFLASQSAHAVTVVPPGNRNAEQPPIPGASAKRTHELSTTYEKKYQKIYNLLKRTHPCAPKSARPPQPMASTRSTSSAQSWVNTPIMSMSMTGFRPITSRPCPM